jgi:hypothetical protein
MHLTEVNIKMFCLRFATTLILISSLTFFSCKKEINGPAPSLNNYSERVPASYPLGGFTHISADNPIGFIFVDGQSRNDIIDFVIDRRVKAVNIDEGRILLDSIKIFLKSSGDTLIVSIQPSESEYGKFGCDLHLSIPYFQNVSVKSPNSGLYMSNMFSNADIEVEYNKATVFNHSGSLLANSINGELDAIISIPQNGYCKCYSINGDIIISIPSSTSSTIRLKTVSGTITFNQTDFDISEYSFFDNEVTGKLGSGNGEIVLESNSGNITVKRFP